jgi:putative membrane protein
MSFALAVPLAGDGWGMHDGGGWWVLAAVVMMLFMGGMMWMMMRGMGGSSSRDSSAPPDSLARRESPMDTLDRRLAEGEISTEEYRERREALVDGAAEPSGDPEEERLVRSGGWAR